MIFASIADHACFHAGGKPYEINSIWYTEKIRTIKTCPTCKKIFLQKQSTQIYCSQSCAARSHPKSKTTLDEIQNLLFINNGNFSAVAKILNVSSSSLAKRLKRNGLPNHSSDYKTAI